MQERSSESTLLLICTLSESVECSECLLSMLFLPKTFTGAIRSVDYGRWTTGLWTVTNLRKKRMCAYSKRCRKFNVTAVMNVMVQNQNLADFQMQRRLRT